MDPTQFAQAGIGIAALAVLVYIVRELRQMVRDTNAFFEAMVKDTNTFFGNHLSKMTAAIEALAHNTATLNEKVDRLHDDNVEAATTLRIMDARRERPAVVVTNQPPAGEK